MQARHFILVFFLLLFSTTILAAPLESQSLKIFAVTSDGKGLSANLTLKLIPGTGQVWSSTTPLVGTTTQSAEQTAVKLAQSYTDQTNQYDYLFDIKSNASVVEGPSAGSAMAFLVVTTLQGKTIPKEVGMTGTIASDGSVGPVGGVLEKAREASQIGIKLFMIPAGEGKQVLRENGKVESIYLPDYAEKEWGMKVVEVKNLDQVLKLAFQPIGEIDVNKTNSEQSLPEFIPEPIMRNADIEPLYRLSSDYLPQVRELISSSRNSLSTTLIEDTSLVNELLQQLGSAEDSLKDAEILVDRNYLFSAANSIFLTKVLTSTISDISENPSILETDSTVFTVRLNTLKENIKELKANLDEGMPLDSMEWYVASRQRLSWAELKVNELSQPKTIIMVNGQPTEDQISAQIGRIQDLEFAQAWYEIALQFYGEGKYSEKKIALDDLFKDAADAALIQAEDVKSLAGEQEDILRRINGAKLQEANGSYASAFFDALSAIYLTAGDQYAEETDYNKLEGILSGKINELDQNIVDANHSIVWGKLYLDHAKYYLNGAHFYESTGQGARATQFLQNGISVAFLAEANLIASKEIHRIYDNTPPSHYLNPPVLVEPVEPTPVADQRYDWIFFAAMGGLAVLVLLLVGSVLFGRKGGNHHEVEEPHAIYNINDYSMIKTKPEKEEPAKWASNQKEPIFKLKKKEIRPVRKK